MNQCTITLSRSDAKKLLMLADDRRKQIEAFIHAKETGMPMHPDTGDHWQSELEIIGSICVILAGEVAACR
jgi:hypothetical protein